jgi:uncharacterized protein YndB with AHSA1/START domain
MKWLVLSIGAIALPVLVMVVWGVLLPQDHVAVRKARYARPPDALWAALRDLEALPSWRRDLHTIQVHSPTRWTENGELTLELAEQVPPSRLVTRILPGAPFGGTWTYELTPDGAGTLLTLTERGEVYNPLFRFLSRFVFGHTATLERYLKQLGARFGEETTVTG